MYTALCQLPLAAFKKWYILFISLYCYDAPFFGKRLVFGEIYKLKKGGCHTKTGITGYGMEDMIYAISCMHCAAAPEGLILRLTEQACDLLGDLRDDCAAENGGQRSQQQRAQDYGNDDLHCIGDVEIAALVGDRQACLKDGAAKVVTGFVVAFFHRIPP